MPHQEPEKLFVYVTMGGEIQFADNNRDDRMLLPDTGKSPAETMDFYKSHAQVDENGRLFVPEARTAKNAGEFYVALDAFRSKVHAALGTKNPNAMTPEMIAAARKLSARRAKEKLKSRQPQSAKDLDRER